jgi:hypothetical protein
MTMIHILWGVCILIMLIGSIAYAYMTNKPNGADVSTFDTYKSISPVNHAALVKAIQDFYFERTRPSPDIHILSSYIDIFTKNGREIQLRMPTSVVDEATLERALKDTERAMQDHVQRMRRGTSKFQHPQPLSDYFYGTAYKAAT